MNHICAVNVHKRLSFRIKFNGRRNSELPHDVKIVRKSD